MFARLGPLAAVFQRDYSPLLTCSVMGWIAANLTLILAGWLLPAFVLIYIAALTYLYFAVLMFSVVRTVFGAENRMAVAVVALVVDTVGGGSFSVGAVPVPARVGGFSLLPLLCLLLSRRRDQQPRRRPPKSAELSTNATSSHRKPTRRRGTVSARTYLPAAASVHRSHPTAPASRGY